MLAEKQNMSAQVERLWRCGCDQQKDRLMMFRLGTEAAARLANGNELTLLLQGHKPADYSLVGRAVIISGGRSVDTRHYQLS